MKYIHTIEGFQAIADDGRPVCIVHAKEPAVAARPVGMGTPATPAKPEHVRAHNTWLFEFVGRPITQVELADLLHSMNHAAKMADAERDK